MEMATLDVDVDVHVDVHVDVDVVVDDVDMKAFRRILQQRAESPRQNNNASLFNLKQTQQNCAQSATSHRLGATTTDPHSCARRSISSPNELTSSVEEGL